MAPSIVVDGLNKLANGGLTPVVDIVFVHGLRGHPERTWEAVDPQDTDEKIFWPEKLLPETIPNARIFSFGYNTEFQTFYPPTGKSIPHTGIDHHSIGLILKLSNFRRDDNTSTRPIIFVAHSLGGLVVANALSRKYKEGDPGQQVADYTWGTIYLGTPFKGSSKAPWAELATRILDWVGDTNKLTVQDLNKRSEKLQQISIQFQLLVQSRATSKELKPIQVACFFEENRTSRSLVKLKKDIGHIVTSDSATLAGYPEVGIDADHVGMCRFYSVDQNGYKLITGKIKEMIANFKKSNSQLASEGQTVINLGEINMGSNNLNIGGFIMGVVIGTTENAVQQSITNNFGAEVAQALANRQPQPEH